MGFCLHFFELTAFALLLPLCLLNYLVAAMGFCVLRFELAFALVLAFYPLNYLVAAMGFFLHCYQQ